MNKYSCIFGRMRLKDAKAAARFLAETQFSREILTKTFLSLFPQSKTIPITKEVAIVPE